MQEDLMNLILSLKPKEAKKYGILKLQLIRMKKKIKSNKPLRLTRKIKIELSNIIEDKKGFN